jgi:quinol monooxygenase YgiN
MIIVRVKVESSADAIETLRPDLVEMERATREEVGCRDYVFCRELADPNRLRILEVWDSMEALRAHFATPHMAAFRKALAGAPPRTMEVEVHELGAELELPGSS